MLFIVSSTLTLNVSTCHGREVTFTCSAMDFPSTTLRWFFNADNIAEYHFDYNDEYPLRLSSTSQVGGVAVEVLTASRNINQTHLASFLSTMTANKTALRGAGIHSISCGAFGERSTIEIPPYNPTTGSYKARHCVLSECALNFVR